MPIWLTWYSPLEFDYVALLQLRYCLFFVAQNMTVESKHHHGGTPFQILFSLPIWGRDWIGEIPEKIETSWLCSSQGLLSLLIKESSAHHHSFHFFFMKVGLESLCLGFFRNNCKTDKTSTLFAFYSSKNLCQISECCNLIIPDIMLIFQWLLLLHSPGLCFIRYSSADTHVVFYTVNPVLLFSFSAMMGTVWKLILMTLASTTKDYSSYCPKFSRKEKKNSCTTKKRWAAMAFLEIRRYIKDKNSWKWLAAQKRFAGLAKINESECRNSSSSGGGRGLCCRRPPLSSLWLKSWKKTKERPTKIRKD